VPLVEVTLVEGRRPEQLRELITRLTDAVVATVDASRESVRVVIREVPPELWAAGDVTIAERRAAAGPPSEQTPTGAGTGGQATNQGGAR
jgi:4-oxalocrotonate tautomerase